MRYDSTRRTFDCAATLTDTEVLRFCREGYLMLRSAMPDAINRRTLDYLDHRVDAEPGWIPEGLTANDLQRCAVQPSPVRSCWNRGSSSRSY